MTFETARAAFDFYVTAINRHCFDELEDELFDKEACCRFDGNVHRGMPAVRMAFQTAWASLPDEDYRMTNANWLVESHTSAIVAFDYAYSGHDLSGQLKSGLGTGINVYVRSVDGWQLIFEDLDSAVVPAVDRI